MTDAPRCGNCKWWDRDDPPAKWAWCNWPAPVVSKAISHMVREVMKDSDGKGCPVYAPKEPDK